MAESNGSGNAVIIKQLRIIEIERDLELQPRAEQNDDLVKEYIADLEQGDTFPPVEVVWDDHHYWLWDGFTRCAAYEQHSEQGDLAEIEVRVTRGTRRDALLKSLAANSKHAVVTVDFVVERLVESVTG